MGKEVENIENFMINIFYKKNLVKIFELFLNSFLFLLPWQTIFIIKKWELGTIGIFGFEILFWIIAALFFIWHFQNKKQQANMSWLYITSFIFLGYCFLSTFWSPQPLVGFFQALRITESFLLIWILLVAPFDRKKAVLWFIAGATLQAFLGIYQFLTQSTVGFKWLGLVSHPLMETGTSVIQSAEAGRWLRAYGAFPHPNIFGGYLVIAIIFTSLLILQKNIQNKKIFFLFLFFSYSVLLSFLPSVVQLGLLLSAGLVDYSDTGW